MTVKMTRIKNVVIALLLIEFIFALMGYVFLSSNTSLVLATYIFIKNVIVRLFRKSANKLPTIGTIR